MNIAANDLHASARAARASDQRWARQSLDRMISVLASSAAGECEVPPPVSAEAVSRVLQARDKRRHFFGDNLFADPAWDMLLELYAARLRQQRISTSSLCIASRVPGTTALRWISALVEQGLAERQPDPLDGRRIFIMLTEKAHRALDGYFSSLPAEVVPL